MLKNLSSYIRKLSYENLCIHSLLYVKNCEFKKTHEKKIQTLGLHNELQPCNLNKVAHNYSSVNALERADFLLAFGSDFNYQIKKNSSSTNITLPYKKNILLPIQRTTLNKHSRFLLKTNVNNI